MSFAFCYILIHVPVFYCKIDVFNNRIVHVIAAQYILFFIGLFLVL